MASGLLSAELAATCNALGYYDGQKYHLEPHSRETIKDVIRYLRRDEDSHDIRRFLGNTKLLETDLLPILQCHAKDKELFDVVLRLIVNLTTPALIIYNEVVPTDKNELNQYLQIISHLQMYKEAFSDQKTWAVLTEHLSMLLSKNFEDRDDDDQRNIERILILVRNVLHVPANASTDWRPDNDASLHDQVIWALHQSGMLDLLLFMASSLNESMFFMHLLEIICLLVREQPATLLAETASQRSIDEKHRDEQELLKIREKESKMKQAKTKQLLGNRHSNFGGTFVIKNMKSTSDKDLIYHKPLHKANNFTLDSEKKPKKIPKNRMPLKCENSERRSALSVRLILRQFCVEILNAAYNPLMRHVKDCLVRGKTQNNDESYYFTALKFFMEFNRKYKFQVKLVSETMSVEAFYFVQKYLETWHDMMITDKKKMSLWSTRMHIALKAYKELLQNLTAMDCSPEESVRESSKVIKSNVFYVIEYREMLLTLINTYKKSKYSHQYLIDLVETIHIFLKILGQFCQKRKIMVQKQVKRKKTKPRRKKEEKTTPSIELWPLIKADVEKYLSSPVTKEVIPFDAASDKDIEQQKVDAMKRIQILLKAGDCEEAVALMMASREVWPENDCFGNNNMSKDEEINCLKEVFLADLDVSGLKGTEVDNDEPEEISDEETEDVFQPIAEQSFDIQDLVRRFASPKVMSVCITLLSTFEKNSQFTNHCITKMLHRIAWDCKLPAMLFQASLFRKFQQIMKSLDPSHKELVKLAKYVIHKFHELAAVNKKLLLELIFFKTGKEAYEIENGYGSFQDNTKTSQVWEEHEELELERLNDEYIRTKPSEEYIDWIMDNIINKNRSKKSVMKKLKELNLLYDKKVWEEDEENDLRSLHEEYVSQSPSDDIFVWIMNRMKNKDRNKREIKKKMTQLGLDYSFNKTKKDWTEEQKAELKELYEEFKDSEDPVSNILEKLTVLRSRRIVSTTLVKIGCVNSTKDLRRKGKSRKSDKQFQKSDSESGDSSSEDEGTVVQETAEEIRARESIPELFQSFSLVFQQKAIDSYLQEGLQWINNCLEECIEDIDDEPAEIPLLPLSNEAILSIENREFQQFLLSLGIFRPLQQEMYWRFPSTWKEADFRKRQNLINLIIENNAVEDCLERATKVISEIQPYTAKMSLIPQKERSPLKRSQHSLLDNDSSENDSDNEHPQNLENDEHMGKKKSFAESPSAVKKKSRILYDSDESDDELGTFSSKSDFKEDKENTLPGPSKLLITSNGNQGSSGININEESPPEENQTNNHGLVGEQDTHSKRMRLLDSDSEDESLHVGKKKRHIILSDDDDD